MTCGSEDLFTACTTSTALLHTQTIQHQVSSCSSAFASCKSAVSNLKTSYSQRRYSPRRQMRFPVYRRRPGHGPGLPATALLQRREVCRSEDLVVLTHDHGLSPRAKRLELRILPLGLAGTLAVIQVFVGPDMHDLI